MKMTYQHVDLWDADNRQRIINDLIDEQPEDDHRRRYLEDISGFMSQLIEAANEQAEEL